MPAILVVEDDDRLGRLFSKILEKAGYAVEYAATLAAALDICSTSALDGILLDMNLPDGNGLAVIDYVLQSTHLQNTRIIAMSGHADYEGKLKGKINHFFYKPVAPVLLKTAFLKADDTARTQVV